MKKILPFILATVFAFSMLVFATYSQEGNFQYYRCSPRHYVKFKGADTPEKRKKAYEQYGCKANIVMDFVVDAKESGLVPIVVGTVN